MKFDDQPNHLPKRHNSFVRFGPLIAALLIILYGHLIGFFYTKHFGQNLDIRKIIGMIILFIPITMTTYMVGFIPARITGRFFSYLIDCRILPNINSATRFVLIGAFLGVLWAIIIGSIITGSMIAIGTNSNIWLCFPAIGAVTVPTSVFCALIENRVISASSNSS